MEVDFKKTSKVAILTRPRTRDLSHLSRRVILHRSVEFHWIWLVLAHFRKVTNIAFQSARP